MKTKRICLISQAAKAIKLPPAKLRNYLEGVGNCFIIEPVAEITCWQRNIAADIKANRRMLEKDEPETIPELKALSLKLKELAAWMKANNFTHFIEDIWNHDIESPKHR